MFDPFLAQLRRLTRAAFHFFALAVLVLASVSWAQVVALSADGTGPAAPTIEAASSPTLAGQIYSWLAVAALSAVVALMGLFGAYLTRRAKDSRVFQVINALWLMMQSAVAHAEAELRPQVQKALEDGKLTAEEGAALKAKTIELFKGMAAGKLAELQKLLGLSSEGLGGFVSGLLEQAVKLIGKPPAPPPSTARPS